MHLVDFYYKNLNSPLLGGVEFHSPAALFLRDRGLPLAGLNTA